MHLSCLSEKCTPADEYIWGKKGEVVQVVIRKVQMGKLP